MKEYPKVNDESKVGKYPASAKAGGGYVWDEVLEYRVWCHPERGAKDLENGNDYYYAFSNYGDASNFWKNNEGTEEPLALILNTLINFFAANAPKNKLDIIRGIDK